MNDGKAARVLDFLDDRTRVNDVFAVNEGSRQTRETLTDHFLISGVEVVFVAGIDEHRHSGVGDGRVHFRLRRAESGPGLCRLVVRLIRRQLREQKRQSRSFPQRSPASDQSR
jgi:hypothetical protein